MTDKQIIIDGIDVSGCEWYFSTYFKPCDGCKNTPDCHYKKWQRKEQECEGFRKANDEKNELLAKLGCPTIATARRKVFCLQEQLDQLKAENDELKDLNTRLDNQRETYWKGYQKLKQTLTEIKEIARVNSINTCWTAINLCADCDEIEECGLQSPFEKLKAIIQKISEVEDA